MKPYAEICPVMVLSDSVVNSNLVSNYRNQVLSQNTDNPNPAGKRNFFRKNIHRFLVSKELVLQFLSSSEFSLLMKLDSLFEVDCSRKVLESSALKMRRILFSLLKRKQKRLIYSSQV
jgi:hypothetical protein